MDYRYIRWDLLLERTCRCLFRTIDGHPMSFCFNIDNTEVKTKFEDLVVKSGGQIVEEYVRMTPTTALMVDDKCVRNFYNRVSFKTSYIIDCIKLGKLKHINEYIHSTNPEFKNEDYMEILFYGRSTFNKVSSDKTDEETERTSLSNDANSAVIHKVRTCTANVLLNENHTGTMNACESERVSSSSKNDSRDDSPKNVVVTRNCAEECLANKCLNPCAHCFIDPKGNLPNNSSCILPNGISGTATSSEKPDYFQGKHCLTCTCNSVRKDNIENRQTKTDNQTRQNIKNKLNLKNSRYYEVYSSSSNSTSSEENTSRRRLLDGSSSCSDLDFPLPCSSGNNVQDADPLVLSEDEDDIGPPIKSEQTFPNKHTRQLYTRKEQEAILKYIIKKDAINCVGGVNIWKSMERSNICPQRTWMSLQNHFKRTLLNDLEKFTFLTSDQIKTFRK